MILRYDLASVFAGTLVIATDRALARESSAGNRLLLVMPLNMTSWHCVAADTYPILCVLLESPGSAQAADLDEPRATATDRQSARSFTLAVCAERLGLTRTGLDGVQPKSSS